MVIDIKDFRNSMFGFPFLGALNYSKIFKLSDRDFSELYLKLMEEYRDKDGWWSENKGIPHCSKCDLEVSGPKDLRRYCGRTLHSNCFADEMKSEKIQSPIMRKYWKRVLKVDFSLLDN